MSKPVRKPTLIFWQIFYYLIQVALRISADKILTMRLKAQKEHPKRWKERLGEAAQVRPTGE